MTDSSVLARLAGIGITGTRATTLAAEMDPAQVAHASDAQLRAMVSGRESGDADDAGHLYPGRKLYPA